MHITCHDCGADLSLPQEKFSDRHVSSSCPYCQSTFHFFPSSGSAPPRIVFESEERSRRNCIDCGREFKANPSQAIPVCPNCQSSKKRSETQSQRATWKLTKQGRVVDIESVAAVRELIRRGGILATDRLTSPEGDTGTARSFTELRDALRPISSKRESGLQTTSITRIFRRVFRIRRILGWSSLALLAFSVAWSSYRITTYAPPIIENDPELRAFIEALKQNREQPRRSPQTLLENALTEISKDRSESFQTARIALEQALIAGTPFPEILGLLAECYALLAQYGDDKELQLTALDVADLTTRLYPDRYEGHLARAQAELLANNPAAAQKAIAKAVELAPHHPRALLIQSKILLASATSQEDFENVIRTATSAIKMNPFLVEGYDLIGQAYVRLGAPDRAQKALDYRLQQSNSDPLTFFRLGYLEERSQNYKTAKEWYMKALRTSPNVIKARLYLAWLYLRIDFDYKRAERHFREIPTRYLRYALKEDVFRAQLGLIEILLATDRVAEADDLAKQLDIDFSMTPAMAVIRARVADALEKSEAAITQISDYVQKHPQEPSTQLMLAVLLDKHRDVNEAKTAYRLALQLDPDRVDAYLRLSDLFIRNDLLDEATNAANTTISKGGLSETHELWTEPFAATIPLPWDDLEQTFREFVKKQNNSAIPLALLGFTQLKRGLMNQNRKTLRSAETMLEKAHNVDPASEAIAIHLGRAYLATGRIKSALKTFSAALKINPSSAAALYWTGLASIADKNAAKGESSLKSVLEETHWGYRALFHLGSSAEARGDMAKAIEHWRQSIDREDDFIPAWRRLLATASQTELDLFSTQ